MTAAANVLNAYRGAPTKASPGPKGARDVGRRAVSPEVGANYTRPRDVWAQSDARLQQAGKSQGLGTLPATVGLASYALAQPSPYKQTLGVWH